MIQPLIINGLNNIHCFSPAFSARRVTPETLNSLFKKEADAFVRENIKAYELYNDGAIKSIEYSKPQPLIEAMKNLATTKLTDISRDLKYSMHNKEELKGIIRDLKDAPEVADISVKGLLALGLFAYTFETEDGNVLKITARNHFPDDRAPEPFDAPILDSGKLFYGTHYYLEPKLSQENITQEELQVFCKEIESQGFLLRDVFGAWGNLLVRQFGKDKNGNLYLCDPGCALLEKSRLPFLKRVKRTIIEMIGMVYEDLT